MCIGNDIQELLEEMESRKIVLQNQISVIVSGWRLATEFVRPAVFRAAPLEKGRRKNITLDRRIMYELRR